MAAAASPSGKSIVWLKDGRIWSWSEDKREKRFLPDGGDDLTDRIEGIPVYDALMRDDGILVLFQEGKVYAYLCDEDIVLVRNADEGCWLPASKAESPYRNDEMLNRIHKAVRYSTLSNYVGIPTDCPHREQNGWTGDAQLSAEQTIMNFDVKSSYSKWLADIRDGQRESGQIPCVVPSAACYNWGTGPAWDAALILIPYYYFQLTGDKELIEENYDSMVKYVSFMCSMQDDYIVSFGLGEWCGNRSTRIPHNKILDTYYSYLIADAMIINSRVLHKEEKAKEYELLADCIKNAYRRHFILSDYPYDESQILLSCAIDSGLLTDDEKTEAAAKLNSLIVANDYHMDCGILGNKHIYNALSENGYCETAYKMVVNPTYPSMAHWILSGMTTLCECWEMTTSLNHHMFSEVDMWMYKYLAGIRIQSGEITINPCFIKNLDFVKAKHRDISVEWDKKKLTVDVPKRATVILNDEKIIVEKGKYTFSL